MRDKITIATRGSKLALWQAEHVKSLIEGEHPGITVELLVIKTKGDKILDVPLAKIGGKGLFVKEIEEALLDGRADLAVHSMKDVPTEQPEGLVVDITPEREVPTDTFCSVKYDTLEDLPQGAILGTSSLRRQAQALILRPDLEVRTLRGNVQTRMGKLLNGEYDAIILATSGLLRLGEEAPRMSILEPPRFIPAVAQGALGIEYRENDEEMMEILDFMDHEPTKIQVAAERGFLTGLDGGCQVPIAAYSTFEESGDIRLVGLVASVDGKRVIRREVVCDPEDAWDCGMALAEDVLESGAREILDEVYNSNNE